LKELIEAAISGGEQAAAALAVAACIF